MNITSKKNILLEVNRVLLNFNEVIIILNVQLETLKLNRKLPQNLIFCEVNDVQEPQTLTNILSYFTRIIILILKLLLAALLVSCQNIFLQIWAYSQKFLFSTNMLNSTILYCVVHLFRTLILHVRTVRFIFACEKAKHHILFILLLFLWKCRINYRIWKKWILL